MSTSVGNINIEITSSMRDAISAVNTFKSAVNSSSNGVKGFTTSARNMNSVTNTIKNSMGGLIRTFASLLGVYSAVNFFGTAIKDASDLVENYNLLSVSVKSLSSTEEDYNSKMSETLEFQNQLNSSFGVMISNSIRYQGFFMNLASALGLSNEASLTLSKNMTQLTYDLASLYNVDFNTMYSKLQSGLVGQTKPLRSVGIDVTMQTLQPTLYSLDINKKVSELTQAQKVMLRYIEILRQSTNAQGDLARTIEQPANQLRILKDQWAELVTWVGTLFIGVLGKVLPALNGIVMALKNVFKYISDIFGFRLSDYTSSMAVAGEDAEIIADYMDEANSSVEDMKKSLMGFDELNILSDQKSNTAIIEDLDTTLKLEEAMKGYDNLMDSVKTKASSISEEFLKWAGFTTDVDGNIIGIEGGLAKISSIAFDNVKEFFKNMKDFVDDVAKWLQDNPEWAEWLINTGVQLGILAGGVWLFYNPFWAIVTAIGVFITYYDDIKNWWNSFDGAEQAAIVVMGLAFAVAALMAALTGGVAGWSIAAGITAAAIAMGAILTQANNLDTMRSNSKTIEGSSDSNKGSTYATNAMNMGLPSYQGNWTTRANGGFVGTGQMFIAREAGPEMVGTIGGRTAVANNDQIVQAVSQGVAVAVSSVISGGNGQSVNIYLDDVLVGNALIDSINRATKNTGKTVMVG